MCTYHGCTVPAEPCDTWASEEKQHSIVSDLCILSTCIGNSSSLPGRIWSFVSIPHTQLQIRNSTTDVSGASAAKSQCQKYYNCALVFFLHLLCGAWKPLACPSGKETCNTEVFPLLCLYPRGFRLCHEILGWLVGPRAGTTAGDRSGKPCSTGMQSWGWLYKMVLCTASKMFAMPPGFPEVDYFQAAAYRVEGTSGAGG